MSLKIILLVITISCSYSKIYLPYISDADKINTTGCLIENGVNKNETGVSSIEDCTKYGFAWEDGHVKYRCCYISYRVGSFYNTSHCIAIADNEKSVQETVHAFRKAKGLNIQCSSNLIKYSGLFLVFLLILV